VSRPVANPAGNARTAAKAPVKSDSVAPVSVPVPPDTLGPAGVELWARLWTVGAGVYHTAAHYETVARYCELTERRAEFLQTLAAEGWIKTGSQGQEVLHPIARQLDAVEGKLVPLEDRLGLSPEASVRLGIATIEHKSKLDAFLDQLVG
jgi:P27 family predicted phage terminase small subunit